MIRLLASIKRYPNVQTIDHATDNEAVVDMYAGMKGRTTAEWLRATDTDIWHEIQQAEAKFAIQGITDTGRPISYAGLGCFVKKNYIFFLFYYFRVYF